MCLMAPVRVVSVDGTLCEVEIGGRVDAVSMMLEPDLQVGDWVLVNSGTVVRRLDPDQAEEMTRAIGIMFGLADEAEAQAEASAAIGAAGSLPGAIP